ncbi:MAG: NUDIX domain-containing protein, partial [Geminicoccaceae bacterium]
MSSWTARIKMALASVILRHRVLKRWAYKQLPKKRLASAVLLFDHAGRLLLVKPSYRDEWLIPGGLVEKNESPWTAARRETLEEIGVALDQLR